MISTRTKTAHVMLASGFVLWGSGCDGSLMDQLMQQDPSVMAGQNGRITHTIEAGGSIVSSVNASDPMSWVYVQLSSGKEVTLSDPQTSGEWDLALLRFQIKVNGGISGRAGSEVALITGTPYTQITTAPQSGYVTDQEDSDDEDSDPDYAFLQRGAWYNYNVTTHVLTPRDQVYVLRSATGAFYKLQMLGYYDQAGSAGYPSFRWQAIASP